MKQSGINQFLKIAETAHAVGRDDVRDKALETAMKQARAKYVPQMVFSEEMTFKDFENKYAACVTTI